MARNTVSIPEASAKRIVKVLDAEVERLVKGGNVDTARKLDTLSASISTALRQARFATPATPNGPRDDDGNTPAEAAANAAEQNAAASARKAKAAANKPEPVAK